MKAISSTNKINHNPQKNYNKTNVSVSTVYLDLSYQELVELAHQSSSLKYNRSCLINDIPEKKSNEWQNIDRYDLFVKHVKMKWLLYYSSKVYRILTIIERILALLLLLFLSPVLISIAIAIKLTSPGPVIFKQKRLGLLCTPITIYKFRTMVQNAEAKTGPKWAVENDERYTNLGEYLRKTRLDELPQLYNVLNGTMSLVGFRPIRHHFASLLDKEIPNYELRFFVKPGITGWPQIKHDYAGSVDGQIKKFKYEMEYLEHANWKMIVKIFLGTIFTIIGRKGQ